MEYETILLQKSGAVTTVTLNRPDKLNAMSEQMLRELLLLCAELREDFATRFVIFTGAGKAFSVGADMEALARAAEDIDIGRLGQLAGQDLVHHLENLEQITIAAINGPALAFGMVVAIACDFRIASRDAVFGVPEPLVGIFFTWGCTPRLIPLIGPAKTKELIMTCDMIDAAEALSIGLVNKVVPPERLMEATQELIDKIASKAPLAVRMTKKIVNAASAPNFGDLYICEPELVERLYLSQDPAEGITAFRENRKPRFTGR